MQIITGPEQLPADIDVCIYGAGGAGAYLLSRFEALGQGGRVRRFADTYKSGRFHGLPVVALDELLQSFDPAREALVIASTYENDIARLLEQGGIDAFVSYKNVDRYILCRLACEALPEGERLTILDVGARYATRDPFWLPIPRGRLRVYGFEPDAEECDRVNAEAKALGLDYTCFPIALWSSAQTLNLNICPALPGSASLYPFDYALLNRWKVAHSTDEYVMGREMAEVRSVPLKTETLDHWREANAVAQVDFIRMNIEGAELEALRGGEGLLPQVLGLLAEVSTVDDGRPLFADMDVFARSKGFHFFDFFNLNHVGRGRSPLTVAKMPRVSHRAGQCTQAYPLYLRDPVDAQARGGDVSCWDRTRILKLAALAELHFQVEYAFELLAWGADLLEARGGAAGAADAAGLRALADKALALYRDKYDEFFCR
jgi:FkbM family methyltransferase